MAAPRGSHGQETDKPKAKPKVVDPRNNPAFGPAHGVPVSTAVNPPTTVTQPGADAGGGGDTTTTTPKHQYTAAELYAAALQDPNYLAAYHATLRNIARSLIDMGGDLDPAKLPAGVKLDELLAEDPNLATEMANNPYSQDKQLKKGLKSDIQGAGAVAGHHGALASGAMAQAATNAANANNQQRYNAGRALQDVISGQQSGLATALQTSYENVVAHPEIYGFNEADVTPAPTTTDSRGGQAVAPVTNPVTPPRGGQATAPARGGQATAATTLQRVVPGTRGGAIIPKAKPPKPIKYAPYATRG